MTRQLVQKLTSPTRNIVDEKYKSSTNSFLCLYKPVTFVLDGKIQTIFKFNFIHRGKTIGLRHELT